VLVLAAIYLVAVVAYALLALNVSLPTVIPDEQRYSQLARSLVHGHGFVWRGEGHENAIHQPTALYVYFIAPMWWLLDSSVDARHASQMLGTLVLCAQVVPVWLVARRVVGPRRALVPAGLSVAGSWMALSALTLTEVLALPLMTASLCCAVMALQRPGSGAGHLAIVLTLLASWARIQLLVFVPVLFAAFLLDALRCPGCRTKRLRDHRPFLIVTGALSAGLVAAWQIAPSAAGDYASVLGIAAPPIGVAARKTGLEGLELVVLCGFVPVALAAAAALAPRLWRDDRTGPLLIVFWLAALVTIVQSGLYLAVSPYVPTGVERYVAYAMPIGLVLMTLLLGERTLVPRGAFVLAILLALAMLLMPAHQLPVVEPAVWSTGYRVRALTGLGRPEALTAAGLVVALAAWLAWRYRPGVTGMLAASALLAGVFAVQGQASWREMASSSSQMRAAFPRDLEAIDAAGGPVALLTDSYNAQQLALLDYYNKDISQVFLLNSVQAQGAVPQGLVCPYSIGRGGTLAFSPACGAVPHRLLLQDRNARWRFHDEVSSVPIPFVGRVVETSPDGPPRAQSRFVLPCSAPAVSWRDRVDDLKRHPASAPQPCLPAVQMSFWLDDPATVTIAFRGSTRDHRATLGIDHYIVRANQVTTVRFDLPAGDSQPTLDLDWATTTGPRVIKAQIRTGGLTRSLIY
jgi:hypothetical protein